MLGLPLAFAAPAALAALVGLVALYWLLRVTPPQPREERFPPLRLLLSLANKETTPTKTPWPLLALRIAVAGAIVLAMAGPIWNAVEAAGGSKGVLLVILDDGWAAAPAWDRRLAAAREAMRAATSAGRLAAVIPISEGGAEIAPLDAANFAQRLNALRPAPWAPDRTPVLAAIDRFLQSDPDAEILWIADGLELGGASDFGAKLKILAKARAVTVAVDAETPVAISGVDSVTSALQATLTRADPRGRAEGVVRALDARGRTIGEAAFSFGRRLVRAAQVRTPGRIA